MEWTVEKQQDGLMLSALLLQISGGMTPQVIRETIRSRSVRVNGEKVAEDVRVYAGQQLRVFWPKSQMKREKKPLSLPEPDILYEDERVMVVCKPQGIESQSEQDPDAGDTALSRCRAYLRNKGEDASQLHLCHRLDVQTGGVLFLAKDHETEEAALAAFAGRTWHKVYRCRVKGCPAKHEAILHGYLRKDAQISRVAVTDYPARGAAEIWTGYKVLEAGENALLEVELITGKTHQIRAHMAHIGHPILGDDKYGDRDLNRRLKLRRQQLWAVSLMPEEPEGSVLAYLNGMRFEAKCLF